MAQLGRFFHTVQDTDGDVVSGASITIYREGATVNGAQSGTSPLTVTVHNRGKIIAADTVFINTTTGTTYSVNSVTGTTVVLSGFVGTLNLANGDRIIPSNSQPTLYSDDHGGATTTNPLTTSSTGIASCWINMTDEIPWHDAVYDFIVSGGGATTTLFQGLVVAGEAPSDASVTGHSPAGDVFRFGEAATWAAGADNAPYKSWGSNAQSLLYTRVHLTGNGANEQYNVSTRTNFKGNWSGPQVGVIHETQWHGVDGEVTSNMFGEQSVARIATTTAGGAQATATLIAAMRGDVKISTGAAGTVTDATGVQGVGPNKVGTFTGTITRGSGIMARTGDGAQVNYAIQMEQGGGIVALQGQNTFTLADNPGITTSLFHNQFAAKYQGAIAGASFSFRCLDISPRVEFTLGAGTFDSNVLTTLHISPEWNTTATAPNWNGIRVNMRNIAAGTLTSCYGMDFIAPTNSGGGAITRYAHIRLQAPTVGTNPFHMAWGPVSMATPATTLAAMTASDGDMVFVTDSNNADNTGLYVKMNGAWYSWTPGGVAAASDT